MSRQTDIIDCPDIIDTRDLQARIDELESELTEAKDEQSEDAANMDLADWLDDQGEEFTLRAAADEYLALEKFADEIRGYCPDYRHGETLIKEDYFENYARELAEDIGAIKHDTDWPNNCIDWEKAAEELKTDYSTAELNGKTYYFRA